MRIEVMRKQRAAAGIWLILGCLSSARLQAQFIQEFPVPSIGWGPAGISQGPDGNLWFAANGANAIVRMTPEGQFEGFHLSTVCEFGCWPNRPVPGPDGAMWFGEELRSAFGRVDMQGQLTEFVSGAWPSVDVTIGGDGALWAALYDGIGRWSSGVPTKFVLSRDSEPGRICTAPDGSVWFTEARGNRVGRITMSGTLSELAVPTPSAYPSGIVAMGDGTIWFTEESGNKIGRIDASGSITEFAIPTPTSRPIDIAVGPDNCIWFTEVQDMAYRQNGQIGRLDPRSGVITEYALPTGVKPAGPWGITAGPNGRMWFTERQRGAIGSIDVATAAAAAGVVSIPATPTLGLIVLGAALAAVGMKVLSRA